MLSLAVSLSIKRKPSGLAVLLGAARPYNQREFINMVDKIGPRYPEQLELNLESSGTMHTKHDPVNHPKHYTQGKIECIDALASATMGLSGIEAVCTASAIKYLWRWKHKNGVEDLRKARWYIDQLIISTM